MEVDLSDAAVEKLRVMLAGVLAGARQEEEKLVLIDDLCRRLGISKNTVYWWRRVKKDFPCRPGNPLRFSVAAVRRWMEKGGR